MGITTKSAKAKGRRLQQWLANLIIENSLGLLTEEDVRSTGMGQSGPDLQLSSTASLVLRTWFECKNEARPMNITRRVYEFDKKNTSSAFKVTAVFNQSKVGGRFQPLFVMKEDSLTADELDMLKEVSVGTTVVGNSDIYKIYWDTAKKVVPGSNLHLLRHLIFGKGNLPEKATILMSEPLFLKLLERRCIHFKQTF